MTLQHDRTAYDRALTAAKQLVTIDDWPEEQRGDVWEAARSRKPLPKLVSLSSTPVAEAFPVDVLPSKLTAFVQENALMLNCPPDYIAHPMLVAAGGAIGASRALEIKPGWTERPCLYGVVVGSPGSAKSPALKQVVAPIYENQNRLKRDFDLVFQRYEEELAEVEAIKHAKGAGKLAGASKPRAPALERVYVADTTCEALAPVLLQNPRGLLMIRDELMAWVMSLNQYKTGGKGNDRQFWLAAWAGEPLSVDRKNQDGKPSLVPHPFLGVIGGLPPEMLSRFREERGAADGFLDRLLFAFPEELPAVGEHWLNVTPESLAAWWQALDQLWSLPMEPTGTGTFSPHYVRLTADARRAWEQFTHDLAAQVNAEDFPAWALRQAEGLRRPPGPHRPLPPPGCRRGGRGRCGRREHAARGPAGCVLRLARPQGGGDHGRGHAHGGCPACVEADPARRAEALLAQGRAPCPCPSIRCGRIA